MDFRWSIDVIPAASGESGFGASRPTAYSELRKHGIARLEKVNPLVVWLFRWWEIFKPRGEAAAIYTLPENTVAPAFPCRERRRAV